MGVRKLVSDDQWAFGDGYKGAQSALEVTLVLGSAFLALVQVLAPVALGAGLTTEPIPCLSHSLLLLGQAADPLFQRSGINTQK